MCCGHCPWTTVSQIYGYYFYDSGAEWHVTVCVRTRLCLQSARGGSDLQLLRAVHGSRASRLICCAHCSGALPVQRGRNQLGNSFPSGLEALSWNSSLLAAVQHRIACPSSLASDTVLCSCSH